jgi:hypothetical protein
MKTILYAVAAAGVLLAGGCGPQVRQKPSGPVCAGKATVKDAAAALALQRQNLQAFVATADGVISYQKDGKDRNEPIRGGNLAFVPPDKVFFKGEGVFKEARFGSNEKEFWLRIKYEMDTYWWGDRATASGCTGQLLFDPAGIAEAIGMVNVTEDWTLFHRDGYDILSLSRDGVISKRIYVNACDYRVEQIEYFSDDGIRQVSIELSDYTAGEEGLMIPAGIRAASYGTDGLEQSAVAFKLKNVRPLPADKQKPKLFERPARDGYGTVLRLDGNCEFVEE